MAQEEDGIEPSRVDGSFGLKLDDLLCSVCHKVVRDAITCKNCEALFCSVCATKAADQLSEKCANECGTFVETKCPRFITEQLSRLKIACVNQSRGCDGIVNYDDLDEHETNCGYQERECPGCREAQLQKDWDDHVGTCQLIDLSCPECGLTFKRRDEPSHAEWRCLIEQLRRDLNDHKAQTGEQMRQVNKSIEQLRDELDAFKRQTGEQIKQVVEINYQLQERFERNKEQMSGQIRDFEQELQVLKSASDPKVQQMLNTLNQYKKADIRCGCGGRFCRKCGGCRDWKKDGKTWKRIADGCRSSPNANAADICRCE